MSTTSNISTSRNDVLFHVTGVLPAIEILKTGAIKCSKPSAWERADWPKLSWPSVCKALQVQSISDACETLSEIWRSTTNYCASKKNWVTLLSMATKE
jgi:hypothetical protein